MAFTILDASKASLSQYPLVAVRDFDCTLASISEQTHCFIGSEACATMESIGVPAWPELGEKELKAVAQPDKRPIVHTDSSGKQVPETNSSETGVSAATDPATGAGYLVWASADNTHTQLFNVATGELRECDDYTFSVPAVTFFRGLLIVAWRAGVDDRINVASLAPFWKAES